MKIEPAVLKFFQGFCAEAPDTNGAAFELHIDPAHPLFIKVKWRDDWRESPFVVSVESLVDSIRDPYELGEDFARRIADSLMSDRERRLR